MSMRRLRLGLPGGHMLGEEHLQGHAVDGAGLEMAAGGVVEVGDDEDGERELGHLREHPQDLVVGGALVADDEAADAMLLHQRGEVRVFAEHGRPSKARSLAGALVHEAEHLVAHLRRGCQLVLDARVRLRSRPG